MKTIFARILKTALTTGALCVTGITLAQTQTVETVTTATTADGTISEFGPQAVIIRTQSGAQPMRYTFSERTTYVDETGTPVSATVIRSGLPATVHYTRVGDALVADKVVVRTRAQSPAMTETVTTSSGVISEFGPERLIIRSDSSPTPVRYSSAQTTTYVDEAGNPVAIETVRAGQPVTIQYTQVGENLVASKVIVKTAVVAPVPVIEEKRTTIRTTVTE
ncbi:hypothetical protein EI77_00613 [Prosthecobacter fusiformis]|uniref:YD repeat-containing protein n=1 Tax=Prosthecobacter fusiformis TaxID=48464 RepID=A0A4R7SQ03_9BACT|nr:hypothetical protein [Prosthecobacter fusiformis]TDU81310.1 hypothetical protein EI77_00613 [Prosthecobacter fusiformis]